MTLIRQFIGFNLKRKLVPLSAGAIALYTVLLEYFNRLRFPPSLVLSGGVLAGECHLSANSMRRARQELIDCGYLIMRPRRQTDLPEYVLVPLEPDTFNKPEKKKSTGSKNHAPEASACADPCSDSAQAAPAPCADCCADPCADCCSNSEHIYRTEQNTSVFDGKKSGNADFLRFWLSWPRKDGYEEAKIKWESLRLSSPDARRVAVAAEKISKKHGYDKKSPARIPSAAQWLEYEGWRELSSEEIDNELQFEDFIDALEKKQKG